MATSGTLSSSKYEDRYLKFTWERTGYNASKKQYTIKWSLKGAGGSSDSAAQGCGHAGSDV